MLQKFIYVFKYDNKIDEQTHLLCNIIQMD